MQHHLRDDFQPRVVLNPVAYNVNNHHLPMRYEVTVDQWFSTFHGVRPPTKDSQHLWPLLINRVLQYNG